MTAVEDRRLELLEALNASAASIQQSARSEQAVLTALQEQVSRLGLRGGISLLDEKADHLIFKSVLTDSKFRRVLSRFENLVGFKAEGYRLPVDQVQVFKDVLTSQRAIYVPDSSQVVVQMLPNLGKGLVKMLVSAFGAQPAIYAPLFKAGSVFGVFNLVGKGLEEKDTSTVQAFAFHIAVALDNARLWAEMQAALEQAQESEERLRITHQDLMRKIAEAETLLATTQVISSLDLKSVLETIASQARTLLNADGSRIHMLEEDGVTLRCVVALHDQAESFLAFPLKLGVGYAGTVALTGKPQLIQNTAEDEGGIVVPGTTDEPESLALAPLFIGDQTIGVMTVARSEVGHAFSTHDLDLLKAFAAQAATAIHNARLFDAKERQAQELASQYQTATAIATMLDLRALYQQLYEQVNALLTPDSLGIFLCGPEDTIYVAYAVEEGHVLEELIDMKLPLSEAGLTGWVIQNHQSLLSKDLQNDQLPVKPRQMGSQSTRAWLGVPLLVHDRIIGGISLQSFKPGAFKESDRKFLESLAVQVAISVENARLYEAAQLHARRQEALFSLSSELALHFEEKQICEIVVQNLHTELGYANVGIFLLSDDETQERKLVAYISLFQNQDNMVLYPGEGLIDKAINSRHLQYHPDISQTGNYIPGLNSGSEVDVPILFNGQVIGVLYAESQQTNGFQEDDFELLSTIANQTALAIGRARLLQDVRRRADELNALRATATDISAERDLAQLLLSVVTRAVSLLGASAAELALYNVATQDLEIVVQLNVPEVEQKRLNLGEGVIGVVAEQQIPLIIPDYRVWEKKLLGYSERLRGVIAVPLIFQSRLVGVIAIGEEGGRRAFTSSDLNLLSMFGQQAAIAIENARHAADLERRLVETTALQELAQQATSSLDMEEVLQGVTQTLQQMFHAQGVVVALLSPATHHLNIRASIGIKAQYLEEYQEKIGAYVNSRVIELQKPVYEPDLLAHPEFHSFDPDMRSLMVVPMTIKDRTVGTLSIDSHKPNAFTPYDQRLLSIAAAQVAGSIINAHLYREAINSANRLAVLHQASQEIVSASLDLERIYEATHQAASKLIPCEAFTITLVDEKAQEIDAVYLFDKSGRAPARRIGLDEGFSGHVIRTGKTIRVDDFLVEKANYQYRRFGDKEEIRSVLAVPLRLGNKIIGTLSAQSYKPTAYSAEAQEMLELLGAQAAIAIDNAKLFVEVELLAVTDALTGIANRRAFDLALNNEVARATRYGHPLSLIFLDLDDFRVYNNTYGHPGGDERLKAIAQILKENIRTPDFAARYGGEEFVVLLPHTEKQGAVQLAERLRQTAAKQVNGSELGNPIAGYTISLGVADFPNDSNSAEELLFKADQAELKAKRAGKNQVCVA